MSKKLENLRAEFDQITKAVESIHNRATSEDRDLSETEDADITKLYARADELKPQIETEVANANKLSDVASIFARANGTADKPQNSKPEVKPSEYLLRALNGTQVVDDKIRALDVVESGTSAGLVPYTIQGGIIDFFTAPRQTIDSLTRFPVPNGSSFKRRVLARGTTVVGAQGSENSEVATGSATVTYVDVTPATYAGAIRLTIQALNDTTPNVEDIWMGYVAKEYAVATNTVVAAALRTAATYEVTCNNASATAGTVMYAIMAAADTVYSAYGQEADTIWVSQDTKSWLAALIGSDGHLVFPMLNPQNRDGSTGNIGSLTSGLSIGGLKVVVDPHFASSTFIVGCSAAGEVYESMYPTIQAWVPSTLAKEVAIAGELATYFRSEGFVKLVDRDGNAAATPNWN